jgi:hypothetical protein
VQTTTAGASEYDRFGPWIDEVRAPDDVPRLFRDHPVDLEGARLVLKVPRNIARRDATPDMDLYDHLLVLDDRGLTVLSRRRATASGRARTPAVGGYDVMSVPYAEVVAVRDVVNLLDGRLHVHAGDGTVLSVRYNGSGRANIGRLVTAIREGATTGPPSDVGRALLAVAGERVATPPRLEPGRDDVALPNYFSELLRQDLAITPWTCHGRVPVSTRRGGVIGAAQRALHSLSPMTLHGAIIAGDDAAAEVVGRHEWLVRGRAPVHSLSRLVLPLSALDRLDIAPHGAYADVTVIRFGAAASTIEMLVPEGSPAHRLVADAMARAVTAV